MAESKRIFNAGKMNRDLDDRLVPSGEYRDALNVGIGRSEGSDVGAVENLKGNELVDDIGEGTTIGVARDQANDRIYWFNTSENIDAIYEYENGVVRPILIDQVSNPLVKPTCIPDFTTPITRPVDDVNVRPDLPDLPTPPVGTCMLEFGPNGRENTNYDPTGDYADNGSCIEADPPVVPGFDPVAEITGTTVGTVNGPTIVLDGSGSDPGEVNSGTPATFTSFNWSDDQGGSQTSLVQTYNVTARGDEGTITVTLSVTSSASVTSVPVTHTITYSLVTPNTYQFSWTPSGTIVNATISGGVSAEEGVEGVPEAISEVISIVPDTGFQWLTLPTVSTSPTLPSGVTGGDTVTGTIGSTNGATVSLAGTWDPIASYTGTATFTGGSVEMIPPVTTEFSAAFTGMAGGVSNSQTLISTFAGAFDGAAGGVQTQQAYGSLGFNTSNVFTADATDVDQFIQDMEDNSLIVRGFVNSQTSGLNAIADGAGGFIYATIAGTQYIVGGTVGTTGGVVLVRTLTIESIDAI